MTPPGDDNDDDDGVGCSDAGDVDVENPAPCCWKIEKYLNNRLLRYFLYFRWCCQTMFFSLH